MDTRRKILFYLNPESSLADRYACERLEQMPQGDRGKLNRATLLSGFALQRIDPRLPHLLAELLTENTTAEEILQVLRAVLPRERAELLQTENVRAPSAQGKTPTEPEPLDETRKNAMSMFGRGS